MLSITMRALCVLFWTISAALGRSAWLAGDWRGLIEQLALTLLALVLWFAVPPGASELRAPSFGTRGLRIALYAGALAAASIATSPWPAWLDDSRGSGGAVVLLFAVAVIGPFLQAERRTGPPA